MTNLFYWNMFRVKLMEMLLSWDSLFNHGKGLHHLWRSLPLLQKEMLLRMKKVLAVLKRMLNSVLGNVSFWSFVTLIIIKDFFSLRCMFQLSDDLIVYICACSISTKEACFTSAEAISPKSKSRVTQASTWSVTKASSWFSTYSSPTRSFSCQAWWHTSSPETTIST